MVKGNRFPLFLDCIGNYIKIIPPLLFPLPSGERLGEGESLRPAGADFS